MNAITQKSATGGQTKQINRFGADAIEKVLGELGLNHAGAQRVIENGDEFASAIRNAALASLKDLSVTDKYKDEEVTSSYGYLSGYKPKPLAEQVVRLKELHPQLKDVEVADSGELPAGAEGWFAIPNIWKADSILTGNYNDSVKRVLDLIKQDRNGKFHNYRDGQLGPERLRQSARAEATMLKLSEEQGHPDILVIAAQFGLQHRGRSVRRAREVMVDQNQFGLGSFAVGIMMLTHPERLQHYDDLWIDCAGDEFDDPDAGHRFARAPYFLFRGGKVGFVTDWTGYASDLCGSASGVLPQ